MLAEIECDEDIELLTLILLDVEIELLNLIEFEKDIEELRLILPDIEVELLALTDFEAEMLWLILFDKDELRLIDWIYF